MKVLVLGASGQVGSHLRQLLPDATFRGRDTADFTDPEALERRVLADAPAIIVNAAAYTAVDRAESEPELAWRVNADGPAALARAARQLDAALLHFSTDYVFDGTSSRAYVETDAMRPQNVYGRTKLAGELAIASLWPKHWILRTSWVFSQHGNNFVKTMLRLARERETLRVVDDQHGSPTYAGDLARLTAGVIEQQCARARLPFGLYHVSGGAPTTWCRFAREVVERAHSIGLIDRRPAVEAITTAEYPTPATRPARSLLAMKPELVRGTGVTPDWESGLDAVLAALARAQSESSVPSRSSSSQNSSNSALS
jgi:dTDP-4-dehydrorhamnose reductase